MHTQVRQSANMATVGPTVEVVYNDVRMALRVHPDYANHVVTHISGGRLGVMCIRDVPAGQQIGIAGSFGKQQSWLDGDERFPIQDDPEPDVTIRARKAQTLAACAVQLAEAGGDPRAASRTAMQWPPLE
jgi:hypothetical protein